jgi:hypothetical protein
VAATHLLADLAGIARRFIIHREFVAHAAIMWLAVQTAKQSLAQNSVEQRFS